MIQHTIHTKINRIYIHCEKHIRSGNVLLFISIKMNIFKLKTLFLFTFFLKFVPQGMIIGAVRRLSSPAERTLFVSTLLY